MKEEGQGSLGIVWGWGFLQEKAEKTLQVLQASLCKQKAAFVRLQGKGVTLNSSSISGNVNSHCRLNL